MGNNRGFLILLFILFIACNKTKTSSTISVNNSIDTIFKKVVIGNHKLTFPDTVLVNTLYQGEIDYNSILDTINLSSVDKRYIFFYVASLKNYLDFENLKTIKHDTFVSLDNHIIPFEIKFQNLGNNYLNGFIEDEVYIANFYSDGKTRIITHQLEILKEVYVKDLGSN